MATTKEIVERLAPKFIFGYHDEDDMRQYGYWAALTCPSGSDLERHIKNRIAAIKYEGIKKL
jgi:hypothetical protein